jgi:P4 family phage/plasmid primase-like protien
MQSSIYQAALQYAQQGLSIVPVSKNKMPLIKGGQSWSNASTNPEQIKQWFSQFPEMNIATVTGKSGLIVIDTDERDSFSGEESLKRLVKDLELSIETFQTLTVITSTGGKHRYYKYPAGNQLKSQSSLQSYLGVDLLADDHLVILPPSIGSNGNRYCFEDFEDVPYFIENMNELPEAFINLLLADRNKSLVGQASSKTKDQVHIIKEGNRHNAFLELMNAIASKGVAEDVSKLCAQAINSFYFQPPWEEQELESQYNSILTYWKSEAKKRTRDITEALRKDHRFITVSNGSAESLLRFNGKFWENYHELALKKLVRNNYAKLSEPHEYTKAYQDLLVESFEGNETRWWQLEPYQIPLKDYIWDCKSNSSIEYKPEHYLKNIIQVCNFNPNAETPIWDKCLFDWFQKDNIIDESKVQLLHEYMGYCFTVRQVLKKLLVCLGEPNTGKSLIGSVLTEIIGKDNVSFTKLHEINGEFGKAQLPDRFLNIDDEPKAQKNKPLDETAIKMIVSPDPILEINAKNKSRYNVKLIFKIFILANNLPKIEDLSGATFDRMLILKFDNQIPPEKRDSELINKLRAEYEGIVGKAIIAFSKLVEKNCQFTIPSSSIDELKEYQNENNPLYHWIKISLEYTGNSNHMLTNTDLFRCYERSRKHKAFAEYELPRLTEKKLSRELNRLGIKIESRYDKNTQGTVRCSIGYQFKYLGFEIVDRSSSD